MTETLENTRGFGDSVAVAIATAVPVPLSVAVCDDPLALSATESVAVNAVAVSGVNVTVIVHEAFAASVVPQVVVSEKSLGSVPPIVIPEMFSIVLLVFFSVRVWPADGVFTV